jgi:hypothetical protein
MEEFMFKPKVKSVLIIVLLVDFGRILRPGGPCHSHPLQPPTEPTANFPDKIGSCH